MIALRAITSLLDLDRWQEVAQTMRKNRLRTVLTAFGVAWGMFMLLVMLGFGDGLERAVTRQFGDNATNSVFVWGRRTSLPFKGHRPGRSVDFRNADVDALRAELPGILHLAPRNQLGGYRDGVAVARGAKTGSYAIMGDTPEFRLVQPMVIDEGRFINARDVADRRKVAVIGKTVADELYEPGEPVIGSDIQVRGVWFQVVGLIHSPRGDEEGDRNDATLHVPFSTFQQAFNYGDEVGWIAMVGRPEVDAEALEADVKKVLAQRHAVHPEDNEAFGSFNAAREFGRITTLFGGIRFFTWFVGVATLLSGAVGVSNILLITVKERTKEIGVRRAIGATGASVVGQIMQEAVVLTAGAGYAGLVAGVAVLEIVSALVGEENEVVRNPQVDFEVALAAAVSLVVAGAFAGVVPAQRAASIHPVEALRAE